MTRHCNLLSNGFNNTMDDFCDCSQCPHHCGDNEEEDFINDIADINLPASSDSDETSDDENTDSPSSSIAKDLASKKVKKMIMNLY